MRRLVPPGDTPQTRTFPLGFLLEVGGLAGVYSAASDRVFSHIVSPYARFLLCYVEEGAGRSATSGKALDPDRSAGA